MELRLVPVTDRLFQVVGRNQGRFPSSHSFLVLDTTTALIDTGCGPAILERIRESYSLDLIINSHGHPDHSSGNWLFPDVPLYAPIEGADSHGRLVPLSHRLVEAGPLADRWRRWVGDTMGFRDRVPTSFYEHGHVFDFGHLKLQAIRTPGHTVDHYCFFQPEQRILLSSDIDVTPFGPWYGHRESSLKEFRRSIDLVRALDAKVLASSHLDVLEDGIDAALDRYARVLDDRSQTILNLLNGSVSLTELVDAAPIYGRHPYAPELLRYWEGLMIELHLEELAERGLVAREGETFRRN
jgi:glyoxylase-like metal-dependent hydrolase (beta-lactamase superfamily II)